MSFKAPSITVAVLLISLTFSMMLSSRLAQRRASQTIQAHLNQYVVRAGFNKFLSQIAWIRLIQFRGGLDKVTKENVGVLIKKYDHLTNLDPMFFAAYEAGALDIGWEDAEKSLHLLDKAIAVEQMKNWKIPFYAGFIAKMRLKNLERAVRYLEKASKYPDCPSYVHRFLINTKAELYPNDPLKILNFWADYYLGGPDKMTDIMRVSRLEDSQWGEGDRKMVLSQVSRISSRTIAEAQNDLQKETDPARKKMLQDRIEQIQKIVRRVYAGVHVCQKCFRPYNAGDLFCIHDGKPVEPYGICPKDQTVVRGVHCQKCGTKVN